MIGKIKKYFILLILMFLGCSAYSQKNTLEEIVLSAKENIYAQPLMAIQVGDSLYNNLNGDFREKINGLLLISDALISVRNYSQSLSYATLADEILKENYDPDLKVKTLNRFGYLHFLLHLFDEGLQYLDKAEIENHKVTDEDDYFSNFGYTNTVRGLIYENVVGCDMALRYYNRGIEAFDKSDRIISKGNTSIVFYNIGNCFLNMENYAEAKNSFEKAYSSAEIYGELPNSLKLFAHKGIANIYMEQKRFDEAIELMRSLFAQAEEINDKLLLKNLSQDLSTCYLETGNWGKFEDFTKKYDKFDAEIIDFKKEATIYALAEMEKAQDNLYDSERKNNRKEMTIISLGLLIVFLILILGIIKKRRTMLDFDKSIFEN